ncbi:PEGA domain-containing protein [bacterium D16-51]|nr:PEGA domain-containing protein [bacterium D16-59]RKI59113.1 PEGA domain-containing protein [bacterium D16-51]
MLKGYKRYRGMICCMLVMLLAVVFTSCSAIRRTRTGGKTPAASPEAASQAVTGVVIQNDTEERQLQIRELETNVISTLAYSVDSVIQDKYKEERYAEEVEAGMILQANYSGKDAKLVSAEVPDDVWEYQEVQKFSFSSDENMMRVAGSKYQYSGMTFFAADGMEIEPMEFTNQDVVTVRGIGIHVYSVVRTAGHGYIRLANHSSFIGGMAELNGSTFVPVSENTLITAAEGTYRLTLSKKGASATKTVKVKKDKEVTVDFSDYKEVVTKNISEVTFNLKPEGAELYLNGTAVNYSTPVTLNYGKYNLTAALTGYETYTGVLEIAKPTVIINIDLIDEKASASSSTPKPSATPSSENDDKVTKKIDSSHTITVSAPEGAEVYLDNVYKGLAPCTFTKVIGSQTITLSDLGYVTKSYPVDILDDGKNVKLSFGDLVKDDTESKEE